LILLDANFLIKIAARNPDPIWLDSLFKFIAARYRSEVVGIPASSWAEVLSLAGPATAALTRVVHGRSAIQVIPFDEIAAIESGFLHQKIVQMSGGKRGASSEPWQKIKIDRQILAIALARRASAIFTDDIGLCADAALIGMPVVGIDDVPTYPTQLPLIDPDQEEDPDVPSSSEPKF